MARLNEFFSLIDFESMRRYFIAYGKTARYTKGECFVEAGQIGRYVGFVTSGYFKYCILNSKGDFAITGFSFADECVMDFTQSFLFDKPSKISIIAGVDSEVVQAPLRKVRDFITDNDPPFIQHATEILLEEAYGRYLNIYEKSPTERYTEIIENCPDVLRYVTLRDIASYLMVTPIHLSRIRKSLGK